jgi:hypothetical protein
MVAFKSALFTTLLLAAQALAGPAPGCARWDLNMWCDFDILTEGSGQSALGAKYTTRAGGINLNEYEAGRIMKEIGGWSKMQYTANSNADRKIVTLKTKKHTKGQCADEFSKMKQAVQNGLKTKDPLARVSSIVLSFTLS